MLDIEYILNLYPVFKQICSFLSDFDKCCFALAINSKHNLKFCFKKQNFIDCTDFKPSNFKKLNMYNIDVHSLNWDACCRHRTFSNDEILHFFKFIPMKQLQRWRKFSILEKKIFTLFAIK